MNYIVEGPDGVGKSTYVKNLAIEHNCDILAMTKQGNKTLDNYIQIASNLSAGKWVSDRSFISEYVYSRVYGRASQIKDHEQFKALLGMYLLNGWEFHLMIAKAEKLYERINERGIDKENLSDLERLENEYRDVYWYVYTIASSIGFESQVKIIDNTDLF